MISFKQSINENKEYNHYIGRKWLAFISLVVVLVVASLISISGGSLRLPLVEIIRTLFGGGEEVSQTIIFNVRMPRIATGIAVGCALAMAGCIMQNVLRNPLASASTLGIAQGASFGAAVGIVYFQAGTHVGAASAFAFSITNPYTVTIFAFLGGITSTILILLLSRVGGVTPTSMILAGVALSAMFTGATALVQYFADEVRVASSVYWTFGNHGRAGWNEIALIFIVSAIAFLYFICNRWNYNAMENGTHTAKSLGVNVEALILISMAVATLISAVAIAFVGTINFIGLIAPHIVRKFVGNDHRFLIPCSAIMGATIILMADIASRMIAAPAILPIGAITSFLGAPLFIYLIIKKGKQAR
jgi:iron complex transport system permease protein